MAIIEIQQLNVAFNTHQGRIQAVEDVSLSIERGQITAIVGESGSGKSVTMLTLMGLNAANAEVEVKQLAFDQHDLLTLSSKQRRALNGAHVSMIFQEPMASLNPSLTIGFQIIETLQVHQQDDKKTYRQQAIELLKKVGIPSPEKRLNNFPHELSGGMCQRIMIAMAIACQPKLLIADEPTTALDTSIQAQILSLLCQLHTNNNMGLILITHDMGVVAEIADRVIVMYAGQIVEDRSAEALFKAPRHPYTRALLKAMPEFNQADQRLSTIPGQVPGFFDRPHGCLFQPRCTFATDKCQATRPALTPDHKGQLRCYWPLNAEGIPEGDHP